MSFKVVSVDGSECCVDRTFTVAAVNVCIQVKLNIACVVIMRCITLKVRLYSVVPTIYTSVTGVWLSCQEGKLNKCDFIHVCVCVCV
jgi:hypothetical protein